MLLILASNAIHTSPTSFDCFYFIISNRLIYHQKIYFNTNVIFYRNNDIENN